MENNPELPWTGERFVPSCTGQLLYEHLHRYAVAAALADGKRVLDIACGEGYGSNLLAATAAQVIGVDIASEVIAHARANDPRREAEHHCVELHKAADCLRANIPDVEILAFYVDFEGIWQEEL